jgi:hypothetical protein
MAMQIVMDHSGDTRHYFDPNDVDALSFTMSIDLRKPAANGALLGNPGSFSTALWEE